MRNQAPLNSDFYCRHCGQYVSVLLALAGVHHRNHCPYCLWSRHLDLYASGDRLSACKAPMQPIGLALKRTHKKYGPIQQGELLLIHRCTECGQLSLNRLAADDDDELVLEVFYQSAAPAGGSGGPTPALSGSIQALDLTALALVQARLFGRQEPCRCSQENHARRYAALN